MKKVALSALAALSMSGAAYAETLTLYTDSATGQVFTSPAEGRVEMGDFVDAKTVYLENQAQDSVIAKAKAKKEKKGYVNVKAKASKLQFSGKHYLGYVYKDNKDDAKQDTSTFETRRNYFQVKAYMFDDKKSHIRMTLDTTQDDAGDWKVRLKYAFLYLDNVLPYTGIELGQVHRPWIDYESNNAMHYRSISKVFAEAKESAHLTNSAGLGFNLRTKTPYFSSEIGLFNGEGYHAEESGEGNSLEWRATAAVLGNGDKKRKALKDTYFDASFFGQYNVKNTKNNKKTFSFYGLHTVYNAPAFLISAQYVMADNDDDTNKAADNLKDYNGKGFSVNGTYRFTDGYKWELFGRYDGWTAEDDEDATTADGDLERDYVIAGVGYQYNKNVKFIANTMLTDPNKDLDNDEHTKYMLTAEVKW